jgi:hypothetical protein
VLAAELAIALHVGGDAAVGQQRVELAEAKGEAFELLAEGRIHGRFDVAWRRGTKPQGRRPGRR